MKTFDTFNYNKLEKLFLKLAHLDELVIDFDFINEPVELYYFYKYNWLFKQDKINGFFQVKYNEIWEVIESNSDNNNTDTRKFVIDMIEKYFKINNYFISKYHQTIA